MAIQELVSRIHYISGLFEFVRKSGINLDVSTDFDELRSINKSMMPGVNVADSFDNRKSKLTADNAFWIKGVNDSGEIVHCQAVKILNLKGSCLGDYLVEHSHGYPPPGTSMFQNFSPEGIPPMARKIRGRVCYHGELWIKPGTRKLRGSELIYLLPRLAMTLALTQWSPDYMFGFMFPDHAYRGLSTREGYQHIGPTDWLLTQLDKQVPQEVWITWMSQEDLAYLLTLTPDLLVRSIADANAAPVKVLAAAE